MYYLLLVGFLIYNLQAQSQSKVSLVSLADADSNYVQRYFLRNELRAFYGGQGNNIALGSSRDAATQLNGSLYTNTNDYIGFGLTYKLLDGDVSFALPGTTYLKEDRSNLSQFKLAMSYNLRKISMRGYLSSSQGVVLSEAGNNFESQPSLDEFRIGLQAIYIFNSARYSFRASMYQSEYQNKTAGSFLLRIETFYRSLGGNTGSVIPASFDTSLRFGDQAGLEYIHAPGFLIMPGYGVNIVIPNSHFFISPIVLVGAGTAFNSYESASGKKGYNSIEYAGYFNLNAGYNGNKFYTKIQATWTAGYATLDPSYLTSSTILITLMGAYRFGNLW